MVHVRFGPAPPASPTSARPHEPSALRRLFSHQRPSGGQRPCAPVISGTAETGPLRLALREACSPGPDAPRMACATFTVERRPRIVGRQNPGTLLSVEAGSWTPQPTRFRYQWYRDGRPIPRATGARYRVDVEDRGARLSVKVTAVREGFAPRTATGTVH